MNFDFTKTIINGIKFWTKQLVQNEISKIDAFGDADPLASLLEADLIDPAVDENNAIYTDENGNIYSL